MKFKSKEDLDAPIEKVFELLADFERHERSALRRGIEVSRVDSLKAPGVGARWDAQFRFRGKPRKAEIEVVKFEHPAEISVVAHMHGMDAQVEFLLVALSKTRTRLSVATTLTPQTLSARLLVQSFKLARGNITKRFDSRMASWARDIEARATKIA
ncbi:MAG: SRPBCC family protein [Rhodobacteraceae bacterium]|nr:SRPBCC family protein [Paracoccaceae bacterium]MCW9042988.1 SRPBCC family protein [Pseudopelagicola sp.]